MNDLPTFESYHAACQGYDGRYRGESLETLERMENAALERITWKRWHAAHLETRLAWVQTELNQRTRHRLGLGRRAA